MRVKTYDADNVFAKIIEGTIKAEKIYEDAQLLAIKDIQPVAPIHILVLTKGSYIDYGDFVTNAPIEMVKHYFSKIEEIAIMIGLHSTGYRLVTNLGSDSGQTVFHFHTHIISGKHLTQLA